MKTVAEAAAPRGRGEGVRLGFLLGLAGLQVVSVIFFLGDVAAELLEMGIDGHTALESLATLTLILGLGLGGYESWRSLTRMRRATDRAENALKLASGAFADLLAQRFARWGLTNAEAEVALFTLKGLDAAEIARLRGTAAGTVRAQLGRIYVKSGTHGRGEFVSLFLDALLDAPLSGIGQHGPVTG